MASAEDHIEREGILRQVREGTLIPERAEELAAERGFPGFRNRPALPDPMLHTYWSLAMAVAWIVWRFPEKVAHAWNYYRQQVRDWVPIFRHDDDGRRVGPPTGFDLRTKCPASIHLLAHASTHDLLPSSEQWCFLDVPDFQGERRIEVEPAWLELSRELTNGELQARGTRHDKDKYKRIPPERWLLLQLDWLIPENVHPEQADRLLLGLHTAYERVVVPSARVIGLWSAVGVADTGKVENGSLGPFSASFSLGPPTQRVASDYRTGLPGRPSSKMLLTAELDRIAVDGKLEPSLREQAQVLVEWLSTDHPLAPPPTKKTVENLIRNQFQALKATGGATK